MDHCAMNGEEVKNLLRIIFIGSQLKAFATQNLTHEVEDMIPLERHADFIRIADVFETRVRAGESVFSAIRTMTYFINLGDHT